MIPRWCYLKYPNTFPYGYYGVFLIGGAEVAGVKPPGDFRPNNQWFSAGKKKEQKPFIRARLID